ncbi:MAG: hypothetical protein R3E64_05710 [Halioglobus sp.]
MGKLLDVLSAQKRLWQQRQEIEQLRAELTKLRTQNDSMREGMRRCVTCDYRIDFKQRQGSEVPTAESAAKTPGDYKPNR